MKSVSISFLIFATIFLLSSALPAGKGKDQTADLLKSDRHDAESLQRRKPPVKIPGPKLIRDVQGLTGEGGTRNLSDEPENKKDSSLTNDGKEKVFDPLDSNSRRKENWRNVKDERLVRGNVQYETQEENSRAV